MHDEKPSATLRVPATSAALSSGSSVCGCCQASKVSKCLCWKYKPKHLDTFSKLYIDTIQIPQRIILLAHLCNMQNHKTKNTRRI